MDTSVDPEWVGMGGQVEVVVTIPNNLTIHLTNFNRVNQQVQVSVAIMVNETRLEMTATQ